MADEEYITCPNCKGTGKVKWTLDDEEIEGTCTLCKGAKYIEDRRKTNDRRVTGRD